MWSTKRTRNTKRSWRNFTSNTAQSHVQTKPNVRRKLLFQSKVNVVTYSARSVSLGCAGLVEGRLKAKCISRIIHSTNLRRVFCRHLCLMRWSSSLWDLLAVLLLTSSGAQNVPLAKQSIQRRAKTTSLFALRAIRLSATFATKASTERFIIKVQVVAMLKANLGTTFDLSW